MDWLKSQRPDLVPRYERLYERGAYAPREERERLSRLVRRSGMPSGFRPLRGSDRPDRESPGGRQAPDAEQTSLF